MTLPVFLHIEATPNPEEAEALQGYLSQAPEILKENGGVPVATYDVTEVLDGQEKPAVFMVISFPDRKAINNFFDDPAYQAIIPLRDRGFSHLRFYVSTEKLQ